MTPDENGWREYKIYVTEELHRLAGGQDTIIRLLTRFERRVSQLEVRAGIFGVVGGALTLGIALLSGLWH